MVTQPIKRIHKVTLFLVLIGQLESKINSKNEFDKYGVLKAILHKDLE